MRDADEHEARRRYLRLRDAALNAVPPDMQAPSAEDPEVYGAIVEMPSQDGFATLVVMGEGTTSIYTSVGHLLIGGGEHAPVRAASRDLLRCIDAQLDVFARSDAVKHPAPGRTAIFALTSQGRRRVDLNEDEAWMRVVHTLTPVAEAAQRVIAALRQARESRQPAA